MLVVLVGLAPSLLPAFGWAQTEIDWNAASPAIGGNGSYTGEVNGVDWDLTVDNAASLAVVGSDSTLLRGLIDASAGAGTATYTLDFGQPVYIDWENDYVAGTVGGLAGKDSGSNEFVAIINGRNRYTLEDNSGFIVPPPPGNPGSFAPVFPFDTYALALRAESQPDVDHAYYVAHSIGGRTRLQWIHENAISKAEAWRVTVSPCGLDWSVASPPIDGPGVYTGTDPKTGIQWTLTVTNPDASAGSLTVPASFPTLLRGRATGTLGTPPTYTLTLDKAVTVVWSNGAISGAGSVGGLAGFSSTDEFVEIVGGATNATLVDNSENIIPSGPDAVAPVVSTQGANLRASSEPGTDHAYYLGRTAGPVKTFQWTHNNSVVSSAKVEAWQVCPVMELSPVCTANGNEAACTVPALGAPAVWALAAILVGTAGLYRARERRGADRRALG